MGIVTESILEAVMPNCPNGSDWLDPLNAAMDQYEINDARRAAAFLAQIAQESSELRAVVENLNYSAAGLMRIWPGRFPNLAKAQVYARNPR